MPVPFHRSIDTKGALALSFSAFLVPLLFVLFVDAFLIPSTVRTSHLAYYDDMPSALQQAVYNAPQPALAARALTPKMGYMLGNPLLAARQEVENPDDTSSSSSTTARSRSTGRTSSRATATRGSGDDEGEEDESTSRRAKPRPTSTTADDGDEPESTTKNDPKAKKLNACAWSRMIDGTHTTPLWLTLGLSAGAIAGILIAAFTSYQYGKASRGGAGAAAMGAGAPPPMY